jgi:hypothetical protein
MDSKDTKDNPSGASGGQSSADYLISESGEQQETSTQSTKGKKSGLESLTDSVKEKVKGTAKSIMEEASSTVGTNDDADTESKDLESAQIHHDRIGDASSDPKTIAPSDTVREKAAETIDESQDSEEPV